MEETNAVSETTAAVTPMEFEVDRYVVTCYVAVKVDGAKADEMVFNSPPLFQRHGGMCLNQMGEQAVQTARQQWEQQHAG